MYLRMCPFWLSCFLWIINMMYPWLSLYLLNSQKSQKSSDKFIVGLRADRYQEVKDKSVILLLCRTPDIRSRLRWEPWYQGDRSPQTCNAGVRVFFILHFFWGSSFFVRIFFSCFSLSLFLSLQVFLLHTVRIQNFKQFHQSDPWRITQKSCCSPVIGSYTGLDSEWMNEF